MPTYLISGHNGAGKSTAGRELARRGYAVVETDFEPGLSGWVHKETLLPPDSIPLHPYPKSWSESHIWQWNREVLEATIARYENQIVFFCGGANNEKDLADLFDKRFMLHVDGKVATKRLRERGEGDRWIDGSAELSRMLEWNKKAPDYGRRHGSIVIESGRPVEQIVDDILHYCELA